MRKRVLLALIPLMALVGCGGSDDPKAAASPPASEASAPASEASAPASAPPSEAESPAASDPAPTRAAEAEEPTRPAAPVSNHPAAGFWEGPKPSKGDKPTMMIGHDGSIQMRSDGLLCKGTASAGSRRFQIRFTQCIVPLPPVDATLSADAQSMTIVETKEDGRKSRSTWRRFTA